MKEPETFIELLKKDLQYPPQYHCLFNNIKKAEQLAQILMNKNKLVAEKIKGIENQLDGELSIDELVIQGLIDTTDIGEVIVKKSFVVCNSLKNHGSSIRGPVGLEKGVVVGRSTILGPAYIAENSKIFDSRLRGDKTGSVYVGGNCSLWDYTVIIRSLIMDHSLIHTCNVDDSIVGSQSNFGGTRIKSHIESNKPKVVNLAKLNQRVILANYSYGNKIRVYDSTRDSIVPIDTDHFGTLTGTQVWLASGSIIYPGTIIGCKAKINCTIPLIGHIPQEANYSLFLSVKKDSKVELTGSLKS